MSLTPNERAAAIAVARDVVSAPGLWLSVMVDLARALLSESAFLDFLSRQAEVRIEKTERGLWSITCDSGEFKDRDLRVAFAAAIEAEKGT